MSRYNDLPIERETRFLTQKHKITVVVNNRDENTPNEGTLTKASPTYRLPRQGRTSSQSLYCLFAIAREAFAK
jgi:hypothetical protein